MEELRVTFAPFRPFQWRFGRNFPQTPRPHLKSWASSLGVIEAAMRNSAGSASVPRVHVIFVLCCFEITIYIDEMSPASKSVSTQDLIPDTEPIVLISDIRLKRVLELEDNFFVDISYLQHLLYSTVVIMDGVHVLKLVDDLAEATSQGKTDNMVRWRSSAEMALTVDPKRLLSCSDSEFDHALGSMKMQDLVATVSCLQSEMESEQTRFNDLTAQLSTCPDPSSSQYSVLSEKLVTSQSCLATLMDRNMRCFTKQTAAHPENNVSVVKVGSSPVTPPVVSNGTVRKTSSKEGSFTLRSSTADVTRIVVSTDNHDTRVNGATVAKDTVNHKPVVAKEIPKPVVAKEIPKPVVAKEIPKPVVAKEIPKPVVAKEIPKPVVAKDISKPAVQKHTAVVNNKDTIPVAKSKDNNSVTMDTKLDSASEEKINFSAARSRFESNPAKTQKKVSSSQQMYTVSKPSQQPAPPVQGAPKGRPAAWQQQLKRLASNDFAVPMAVQNTSHMRPHGVQKAASVDQSLKSSLKVNSGQIANRQMSLQEVHHNGSNGHSDVQKGDFCFLRLIFVSVLLGVFVDVMRFVPSDLLSLHHLLDLNDFSS
ncbi:hypothetical protein CAPTEDRAFT_211721 [Capitella teleta]|uniref:Uncharacterized protein n=1 Tax=Capitella teleta TaxID=283909 RepID=R7TRM0_CAPTE|nr:hypothetical protein CAPTEDRAFT_211721 [Capitella teleta]|eukprot:ELT96563.1 hypothetical protein CAPTEDRAFT_211721 [Capitella teleta]